MKSLQKDQNSTNLLLWPPICRNKHAINPRWINFKETNFKFHPNSCKTLVTIRNVEIFLEKTRETKSKQVKQTGQLAAAAAPGLHEHDAVVCSLLLRRRRGRIRRRKSGEEQCKIRCHLSWKGLTIETLTAYDWKMSRSRQEKTFQEKLKSIFKWV